MFNISAIFTIDLDIVKDEVTKELRPNLTVKNLEMPFYPDGNEYITITGNSFDKGYVRG